MSQDWNCFPVKGTNVCKRLYSTGGFDNAQGPNSRVPITHSSHISVTEKKQLSKQHLSPGQQAECRRREILGHIHDDMAPRLGKKNLDAREGIGICRDWVSLFKARLGYCHEGDAHRKSNG